jgi:hypothetical protein
VKRALTTSWGTLRPRKRPKQWNDNSGRDCNLRASVLEEFEDTLADLVEMYQQEGMDDPFDLAERLGREATAAFRCCDVLNDDSFVYFRHEAPNNYVMCLVRN